MVNVSDNSQRIQAESLVVLVHEDAALCGLIPIAETTWELVRNDGRDPERFANAVAALLGFYAVAYEVLANAHKRSRRGAAATVRVVARDEEGSRLLDKLNAQASDAYRNGDLSPHQQRIYEVFLGSGEAEATPTFPSGATSVRTLH